MGIVTSGNYSETTAADDKSIAYLLRVIVNKILQTQNVSSKIFTPYVFLCTTRFRTSVIVTYILYYKIWNSVINKWNAKTRTHGKSLSSIYN